jgi:hypothetical protein
MNSLAKLLSQADKALRDLGTKLKVGGADLPSRSHQVLSLYIEDGGAEERRADFVELCGSELAVTAAGELKEFVSRSFNGLSSQVVRVA